MPRLIEVAGHAAQTHRPLLLSIRIAYPNMSEVLAVTCRRGDRRKRATLSGEVIL
jgi:hypothetical protein